MLASRGPRFRDTLAASSIKWHQARDADTPRDSGEEGEAGFKARHPSSQLNFYFANKAHGETEQGRGGGSQSCSSG